MLCVFTNNKKMQIIFQNSNFTQIITIKYVRHSEKIMLFLLDFFKKQAVLSLYYPKQCQLNYTENWLKDSFIQLNTLSPLTALMKST